MDLRRAPNALVAGFDLGTLYMVSAEAVVSSPLERFSERSVSGVRRHHPHPSITVATGAVGQSPQRLVQIREQLVAVSVGDPTPARVVELYALGRLRKSPTALRGAALRDLPKPGEDALLVFYALGPFTGEWARGARGVLGVTTALALTVRRAGAELGCELDLLGEYEGSDAATAVAATWEDLAQSPLGRLTGLNELDSPVIEVTAHRVRGRLDIPATPLARGLRAAVAADVWEIMSLQPPTKGAPKPLSTDGANP